MSILLNGCMDGYQQYYSKRMSILLLLTLSCFCQGQLLYNHQSSGLRNEQWMKSLDDGVPIRKMNIFGTHSSLSTGVWGDAFQTQAQSLTNQLAMGFRVFDIRCRHYQRGLEVHERLVYLNTNLQGVLSDIATFLSSFPSETVLVHIVEEYTASGNGAQTFAEAYEAAVASFSSLIWTPITQDPYLGLVRGKVVIIQEFTSSKIYGLLYSSFIALPHKSYSTNWDQHDRWLAVKSFLSSSNTAASSRISFWSGSVGSFPYFCASGKSDPRNNAPRLLTGLTTPAFSSRYPDFPRVGCWGSLCSIAFEGINILAYKYIVNNALAYQGIVFTDFLGDDILTLGINSNANLFGACTATQKAQGCIACSKTGVCIACNSISLLILNSATNLCDAMVGYYLSATTPLTGLPCIQVMPGCLQCQSSSVCTFCDTTIHYALTGSSCVAAAGYYLDASAVPVVCPTGCATCTGPTICTSCYANTNFILDMGMCVCDSANNFVLAATVDVCICDTGYFMDSSGATSVCSPILSCPASTDCLSCTGSVCDSCTNNLVVSGGTCVCNVGEYYASSSCTSCNKIDVACDECASQTVCLSCLTNFTLADGQCVCINMHYPFDSTTCLRCSTGCLSCTTATICQICDTTVGFILQNGQCVCPTGFYTDGTTCLACTSILGCLSCAPDGSCLQCNALFGFSATGPTCGCANGFFPNSMGVCEQCTALGCLSCSDQTHCSTCDTTYYRLVGDVCQEVCGDGFLVYFECDDGNTIDGDGCSATCSVETDWTCAGGSLMSASSCSFSGKLTLTVVATEKVPLKNELVINLAISPQLKSFSSLDFSSAILLQFPYDSYSAAYNSTTNQITVQVKYGQSLNNEPVLKVAFSPPDTPEYFYMNKLSSSLPFTTNNNLALKYYPDQVYETVPKADTAILVVTGLYLSSTVLCFAFSSRLMAVQMLLVLQVAFFSLTLLDRVESVFASFRSIWFINGVNPLISQETPSSLPFRYSALFFKASFLSDANICVLVYVLTVAVGLTVFLVGHFKSRIKIKETAYKILKEIGFSICLTFSIHEVTTTCLTFLYNSSSMLNIVFGCLAASILILYAILLVFKPSHFGDYIQFFKKGPKIAQHFYVCTVVYRIGLAVIFGISQPSVTYSVLAVALTGVYLITLLILRPYRRNIRPVVNSLCILVNLTACLYYSTQTLSLYDQTTTTYIIPIGCLCILLVTLVFNTFCWVKRICQRRQDNEEREDEKQVLAQMMLPDSARIHNSFALLQQMAKAYRMQPDRHSQKSNHEEVNLTYRIERASPAVYAANSIQKREGKLTITVPSQINPEGEVQMKTATRHNSNYFYGEDDEL